MLEVLDVNDKKWDEVVTSFKDYDVYYKNGYLKSLEINGDGTPLLFFYQDENCRGINVVLKRDIARSEPFKGQLEENIYFDFSTPYGYGGWIIEGEKYEGLFSAYKEWCIKNGIICEFVRFHPLISNQKYSQTEYEVIPLGQVIAIDCSDEETMWMNMSSRNRNKIRKAAKNGVTVTYGGHENLDTFISIYEDTMKRDNAEDYYFFRKEYYESLFNRLKDSLMIFFSQRNGEILSTCMVFKENERLSYHLAGSTRTSGNLYETNLLIAEVGKWGCEHGCKSFLLGGGVGSKEDYLYQFKRGFDDKHSYQFYIGKKTYLQDIYDALVSRREKIENPGFFPAYRG